ncbi:hypothetical protein U1Q18_032723 [Sarracenia purpurea var. burkii]
MRNADETDRESCKRHEDVSGSSDSSEWVRVRKRRNSKKGKRQDPILDSRVSRNEIKENEIPVPGGFRPSDQAYRSARPSSLQRSRAPAQSMYLLFRTLEPVISYFFALGPPMMMGPTLNGWLHEITFAFRSRLYEMCKWAHTVMFRCDTWSI